MEVGNFCVDGVSESYLWTKAHSDQGSVSCLTDANRLGDYRVVSDPGQRRSD